MWLSDCDLGNIGVRLQVSTIFFHNVLDQRMTREKRGTINKKREGKR